MSNQGLGSKIGCLMLFIVFGCGAAGLLLLLLLLGFMSCVESYQ